MLCFNIVVSAISNIQENLTLQNLIRRFMIKSVGERYMEIYISLDNGKRCNLSRNNMKVDQLI